MRCTSKSRPQSRGIVGCWRGGLIGAVLIAVSSLVAMPAGAGTMAYWRHEEGSDGGLIPAGADTVLDSSSSGNPMRTYDPSFTAATYSSAVSPLALRSGLSNTLSLDFGPGGDDAGMNDDNYTQSGKPINSQLFTAMTVELAFNMNGDLGGWQALFGKDGKPLSGGVPPLKISIRNDGYDLAVEWVDGNLTRTLLRTGEAVTAGTWYHVAFTLTATDAELWVADESGIYTLKDSASGSFAGSSNEVLVDVNRSFTVGRGEWWNGPADWANALIDEVRVSDVALPPEQFLFVPEPSSILLGSFGLAFCGFLRRRQVA